MTFYFSKIIIKIPNLAWYFYCFKLENSFNLEVFHVQKVEKLDVLHEYEELH